MEQFRYTRSWRNPGDFPTVETSEVKVRDDLQSLFDEAAAGINALIDAVNAGGVGNTGAESSVVIDPTLTLSGAAAEAGAVGEGLAALSAALTALEQSLKTYTDTALTAAVGDIAAVLDVLNGEVV